MMIINDKFSDSSAGVIGYNDEIYFAYQDYQGSILAIADDNGSILEEYSYDAWGNRRDVTTLENYYSPGGGQGIWQGFFYRGYTGHEHLECFGLINMNGRLYDPLLGRMLSPDKYVQAPGFSQNFNRYSYAWNNPLTYSDPSGDFIIITAAIVGAYIGGVMANDHGNPARWDLNNRTYAAMGLGALVGGLTGIGGVAMVKKTGLAGKSGSTVLSQTGGKMLFNSMVSGTVNTINNYDKIDKGMGFGIQALGFFASGAIGGALAFDPSGGIVPGMLVGGGLTGGMRVAVSDGPDSEIGYQFMQGFVGGALSVAVGAGFAKSGDLAFLKSGTKAAQFGKKSLWYGGQNVAADFAYSERDDFNFWSRRTLGMFGAGALGGVGQDYLGNKLRVSSSKRWINSVSNNFLRYGGGTGAALTADMTLTFLAKGGYSSFYRKGRETKTGYVMYKTLLYTAFP